MSAVDGRVVRGERNRQAIADALLACYEDGILRPSAAEVAERAGVSVRSVHNHFADMESLVESVAQQRWERFEASRPPLPGLDLPLQERVATLVNNRTTFFEQVAPVRRATALFVHESAVIADVRVRLDARLRELLGYAFSPELARHGEDLLEALDVMASWETWEHLRVAQGLSVTRARRVLVAMMLACFEGSTL